MAHHMKKHPGQLTIVIKLGKFFPHIHPPHSRRQGTSSIVDEKTHHPLLSILSAIVETAVKLQRDGHRVVLVSSGAIGVGLRRMDIEKRPKHLPQVQALAAIGQSRLMSLWDQLFGHVRQPIAQILLTRNDIADRTQYQNAQNTFFELLHMGVIPIVNENDTLSVTEIKFGDNDTLSAITAGMVQADYLFLMTDVDCLYDKNPRTNPDAKAIEVVEDISEVQADVSSAGSALGTGGMGTKIVAASLATSVGVTTVITKSSKPENIGAIIRHAEAQRAARMSGRSSVVNFQEEGVPQTAALSLNDANHNLSATAPPHDTQNPSPSPHSEDEQVPLHTRFLPISHPIRDRYFWILHGLAPRGTVYIDHGAWKALNDKAGLLPVGIVDVEGHFAQQEAVRLIVVKRLPSSSSTTHNTSNSGPTSHASTPSHTMTMAPTPNRNSLYERSQSGLTHSLSSSAILTPPAYELHDPPPFEVGRAVINYSSAEIKRIKGLHSTQIHEALGYADSEYVALRENIAFFGIERSRPSTPSFGRSTSEQGDTH
ncbi:glutamate 5-kinase [Aaosphaeria arxii CBS 175.79]|uniref:Glutamate 5-kinase n=1 Tax=Aaosphaeria arxii CBS 175.79 TaxID=1450172 RepID=A0A6A5Y3H5_9PLEO|nr:glutamate 5-kinase [Aaosphaeria arxii CBS 175.79]KAF2019411.1 glutamate 5-kinase [Aaosphaeria arxii CBS 175.79]